MLKRRDSYMNMFPSIFFQNFSILVYNNTIISLRLIVYYLIIANSGLRPSYQAVGFSRKYSHPPPPPPRWTTQNWVPRNFRISKKDNCSFCRIPEPADSKPGGIPEFRKNLNGFPEIPAKIYKILGEICGFPVILTEHFLQDFRCRPWWGGDIFWNSPMYDEPARDKCKLFEFCYRLVFHTPIRKTHLN